MSLILIQETASTIPTPAKATTEQEIQTWEWPHENKWNEEYVRRLRTQWAGAILNIQSRNPTAKQTSNA
jgi:hypothetical protein